MRPVDLDREQEEDTEQLLRKTLDIVQLPVGAVLCTVITMTRVTPSNPTRDLRTRAATIPIRATIMITRHRHLWVDTVTHYLLPREILA
jgi:hypothetical protein